MRNIFSRKRCKQCGWELKIFSKLDFCSDPCRVHYLRVEEESRTFKLEYDQVTSDIKKQQEDMKNWKPRLLNRRDV